MERVVDNGDGRGRSGCGGWEDGTGHGDGHYEGMSHNRREARLGREWAMGYEVGFGDGTGQGSGYGANASHLGTTDSGLIGIGQASEPWDWEIDDDE